MWDDRQVVRCQHGGCRLVQFMTATGNCRRCHRALVLPPPPAPAPWVPPAHSRPNESLAAALHLVRLAFGVSQRRVGRRVQQPRTWISKVERGVITPSAYGLCLFARALGTTPGFLLRVAEALDASWGKPERVRLKFRGAFQRGVFQADAFQLTPPPEPAATWDPARFTKRRRKPCRTGP